MLALQQGWGNKPPKFRLDILESTYREGGLKMTNIKTFDTALKISWLKRLKNEDDGWEEFPRILNIHKIILFGDHYHMKLLKYTKNKFWRDVINASKMLLNSLSNIETKASNIPIWFNSGINIVYRKTWFQKGYVWESDILDLNGDLFLNEELLNRGLYLNFLDYERLKYDISRLNIRERSNINYGPHIPYILFKIGYQQKGCSNIYRILTNSNHDIIDQLKAKWENILNEEINNTQMEKAFQHLHKLSEGSFDKYIQFKILHRRIVTNKKLLDMNIRDNSKCPYCDEEVETIGVILLRHVQCPKWCLVIHADQERRIHIQVPGPSSSDHYHSLWRVLEEYTHL